VLFSIALTAASALSAPRKSIGSHSGAAGQADILPTQAVPASADLLLTREDERKADAMAAFVEGVIAEESADGEKALEQFQRALNLDPGYTELAIKVAYEQARRGDVAAGINILKDAIKASPKDPLAYLYLAQLYAKYLKKPDLAAKYASQALDIDPGNFASYLALHEFYRASSQPKRAEQVLERAAKLENNDPQFWVQLAEVFTRVYAKEDGSCSPEDLKKINAVIQKAVSFANGDATVLTKAADFYVLTRQVKEAIPLYLKVINLKANSNDPAVANVRDKLARSFRVTGQRDEAIAMLQRLIKDNPMRYESYELLGELFEEKAEFDNALANYEQTLLLDPAQALNYLRVADLYLKIKKPEKAVAILTEARTRFPDLPQITYSLAVALSQSKRHQESLTAFEEALHEAENVQQDMINGAFYFAYGAAAEQAGMTEKAAELLKKSIDLDPGNAAQAYNYLGYMWVDRNENLDEGGELIKRAIEMEPDNAAFIDSLGWFYFQKGDYDKALIELQKAAEAIKPEDAVVYEHLGDTYQQTHNVAQALIFWQKAVALDPANVKVAEKIENAKQKVTSHPSPTDSKPANDN
jgi:tetratricopeptide (TPR) repeat protein